MTTYEAPTLFPAWQTTTGKFETIDDKFRAFHDANPWVADELEKLADVEYRHGDATYLLEAGDSLTFDGTVPHGPERILEVPIRFLTVIVYDTPAPE